jgi:hypothetical protein
MFVKETTGCSKRKHRDVREKTAGVQNGLRYTLKKKVLNETSKKGSVDVEKLPNVSKESKKE